MNPKQEKTTLLIVTLAIFVPAVISVFGPVFTVIVLHEPATNADFLNMIFGSGAIVVAAILASKYAKLG